MSSLTVSAFALLAFTSSVISQVESLNFSFPYFSDTSRDSLILSKNSDTYLEVIQITSDTVGGTQNLSGRALYNQPFNLWSRGRGMKASFRSTFSINIQNLTSPGGEGTAFILTRDASLPDHSTGQWLGLMNAGTVGHPNNIVAVEFDTRKSYQEDIDDNHVGLDLNSIFSVLQEPLGPAGIYLSNNLDVLVSIDYDASLGRLNMSVKQGGNVKNISWHVHLSEHLPENVFVGFSASSWKETQLNAIRAWNFTSFEVISSKRGSNSFWVWVVFPVITTFLLIGMSCSCMLYWKKRQKRKLMQNDPQIDLEIRNSSTAPQRFRLKELKSATGDFSPVYEVGKGGFGIVYKGITCNKEVAVKRILKNSRHGKQDFIAEITIIGNLHHKNLVKLIGWCNESSELLLVYEFMPNGSLDKLLFCSEMMPAVADSVLSWGRRHGIICGVAKALDYLHYGCEKRVLHRDVKSSNILLDSDFTARIGDFGLARMSENTHHSTKQIAGTLGYMAPESFHTGRATVETDIYAFGVLILEIVCGRKPLLQGEPDKNSSIVDWVWEHYRMERITGVIDAKLKGNYDEEQTEIVLMLGLACCHPNPYQRPSMKKVLQVLSGEMPLPKVPAEKPAFMWPAMATSIGEVSVQSATGGRLTQTMELSGR